METDPIQVSRNIKSCRKKFGKTQEIVAGELNITKQTYINIENNIFLISTTPFQKLLLI